MTQTCLKNLGEQYLYCMLVILFLNINLNLNVFMQLIGRHKQPKYKE